MGVQPFGGPPQFGVPVHTVAVASYRRVGKTRNPLGVWLLSFITFGLYGIYVHYKNNDDAKGYAPHLDVDPTLSLFALFVPIAGLVSLIRTGGRIAQAQQVAGLQPTCSGGVGFLAAIFFGLHFAYYQSELNKVWAVHGNPPENTPI